MQSKLKQNILTLIKQKDLSARKLERDAGLHKNYIANFLHDKSKNPGIESIIKIASVFGVSVDELIGRESSSKNYDLAIARKDIFFEVVSYLSKAYEARQNDGLKLENFFNAIYEVYMFSLKKDSFDKEFADWFVDSHS